MQAKGYNVRATVRSKSDQEKVGHLTRLADALPGKLAAPACGSQHHSRKSTSHPASPKSPCCKCNAWPLAAVNT